MLSGRDKLYHALACAATTVAAFLALALAVAVYGKIIGRRRDVVDGGDGGVDEEADCERQSQSTDDEPSNRSSTSGVTCRWCSRTHLILAAMAGIIAMAIGIAKEIGDAYDIWPFCGEAGCQSSGGDILADFIGVVLGEVLICTMLWLSSAIRARDTSSRPGTAIVDE